MRFLSIKLIFTILFSALLLQGKSDRPNIVWILAEDLSQDLRCYGNQAVKTPTLDGLAEQGVKFSHVFTTAAVCAPSRTSLATGMYQTSIDAHHMRYPDELMNELPEAVIPMNELFRRGGYTTAQIIDEPCNNKLDWSFAQSDLTGFDHYHWTDLAAAESPFFALVNLQQTHRPFEQDNINPVSIDEVTVPPYYPDVYPVRRDLKGYYETIQHLDHQVATILRQIENHGLKENTIIFFFSDHGRPFPRAKNGMYDSGTRIPFIVSIPEEIQFPIGYKKGSDDHRLLSSIDIVATSLALAGLPVPDWMEGCPFYGGDPDFERSFVISALDRIGGTDFKSRTIRTKTHRLIYNLNRGFSINEGSTAYRKQMHPIYHVLDILGSVNQLSDIQKALITDMPEYELYDLSKDPHETVNQVSNVEYSAIREDLIIALDKWIKDSGDKGMLEDSYGIKKAFSDYRRQSHDSRKDSINALREEVLEELKVHHEL